MSEEELSSATSESSVEDTPSEAGSEPTPEVQSESIAITTQWLDDLHLGSNMSGASNVGAPTNGNGGTKVNPPMEFTGRRDQIKSFRLQCKLYWEMNPERFNGKARARLLFAMSYLRGKALEWIQPHMENYIDSTTTEQITESTRAVLGSVDLFFAAIKETFDVGNDVLEADRDLRVLRQRTSAAAYRAEFSILAAKVGWNDDALASQFYRGLKDQVRTEITMHHVRPSTLRGMADLAIQIDTRIFEVQMEKKGSYFQGKSNTKVQRDVPAWKDNYYGLQKMQIDATQGKPGSNHNNGSKNKSNKRPQPKTKGTTDKSSVECYGCGKKGHYKSECNARKQRHDLQGSGQRQSQDNSFRATKGSDKEVVETPRVEALKATQGRGGYQEMEPMTTQDPHGMESWTACFDDNCAIHMSDKFGSGYWPAKKTRSVCRTQGQPGQVVRYTAGYPPQEESSTEEESSEEEGEVTESDGELDEPELFEFAVQADRDDATLRILNLVWQSRYLVLPWNSDGDVQHVNESELWELFGSIRKSLWDMPHEKHSTDYYRIVQEYPPLGSRFTARGGYFTPEDICITKSLRDKVKGIKEEYAKELKEQKDRLLPPGQAPIEVRPVVFAEPIIPDQYLQAPREVQRRLQNRPQTPYAAERSAWEPALNTSDPNYVPRRNITMNGELTPHARRILTAKHQSETKN
jgi:hypothetical protein